MKKIKNLVILVTICFLATSLFSSCAVYQPQAVSIPLLSDKGDFSVDAGITPDLAVSANIAYAFTNHFGGQIHGTYGANRYYGQLALGYYRKLSEKGRMEIYAGYGYGYGKTYDEIYLFVPSDFSGNYHLPFVQYNYGRVSNSKGHIEYGVGVKLGLLASQYIDTHIPDTYNELAGLLEPILFFRAGGAHLKFQMQLGLSLLANKKHGFMFNTYSYPVNFSMGIYYKLNFNKNKK
ncbi:MAG: hypothetical protein RRY15_00730 [Bacteroidales bacterium]